MTCVNAIVFHWKLEYIIVKTIHKNLITLISSIWYNRSLNITNTIRFIIMRNITDWQIQHAFFAFYTVEQHKNLKQTL